MQKTKGTKETGQNEKEEKQMVEEKEGKRKRRKGKENKTWGRARSGGATAARRCDGGAAAPSTPVRRLQGLSVLGVAAARPAWALSLSA